MDTTAGENVEESSPLPVVKAVVPGEAPEILPEISKPVEAPALSEIPAPTAENPASESISANEVQNVKEEVVTHEKNPELVDGISKEYQAVMAMPETSDAIKKFKADYSNLFQKLEESKSREQAISKRCNALQLEIVAQTSQVQNAIKLNSSDRNAINNLKRDAKKAWEVVQEAKEREERAKEIIQQLRAEVNVLQTALEQNNSSGVGDEQTMSDLISQKEDLTKERDMQHNQITQLRLELAEVSEHLKELEAQKTKNDMEVVKLKGQVLEKKNEIQAETNNREKLERELKDARASIEQKTVDIRGKNDSLSKCKDEISKLELQVKEKKSQIERAAKDQEQLQYKASKLEQDYNDQLVATTRLVAENQKKSAELKQREEDIHKVNTDIKKVSREKDHLQGRLHGLEDMKRQAEVERDQLKTVKLSLEADMEALHRQLDGERRHIEELTRERDIINKNLEKSTANTNKQSMMVKIQEQTKRNLEQDISAYKAEASKQRKIIYSLEKEREKFISDAAAIQSELMQSIEDMKAKETDILEFKKKIAEVENKLKQQQNLYEAVRTDRNNYSKNLIESQDEITDMKRKLKSLTHQIEQLKDETNAKSTVIEKQIADQHKLEKEKERLKVDLQKLKTQAENAESYFQNQQAEEQKLRALVQEAETELTKQKREHDQMVQERDIIGAQLVKRNEEIALLYEKIKIQQSILTKGEIQYRERLEDIRSLKVEIEQLRGERKALENEVVQVEMFKTDIVRLEKEVIREKSRIKVLEDQLQSPMNVHRWRKLEGTEPETFELIQKIQTLQKRLIAKTEEAIEKELMVQQKEKLYEKLKQVLARQPGPEIVEQLAQYQQSARDKSMQLKAMKSELHMYHTQVNQYKFEIDRLNREMLSLKKLYYEQKSKKTTVSARKHLIARQAENLDLALTPSTAFAKTPISLSLSSTAEASATTTDIQATIE